MKAALIGLTALALTATTASAAQYKHDRREHFRATSVSAYEHVLIRRSVAQLAWVKRQAWADGRITFLERYKIRQAELRHARLVKRAYRY
jgi:hypothetical protein